jgi:hypothetical protein
VLNKFFIYRTNYRLGFAFHQTDQVDSSWPVVLEAWDTLFPHMPSDILFVVSLPIVSGKEKWSNWDGILNHLKIQQVDYTFSTNANHHSPR